MGNIISKRQLQKIEDDIVFYLFENNFEILC